MLEQDRPSVITVSRWHEIDMGHTVTGHGGKCKNLHGHRYRFDFTLQAKKEGLDPLGMVIDFGLIKGLFCQWLENNWDHKFLIWQEDSRAKLLLTLDKTVVITAFNPTAENIADHFLTIVAPALLMGKHVELVSLNVHETLKCSAKASLC